MGSFSVAYFSVLCKQKIFPDVNFCNSIYFVSTYNQNRINRWKPINSFDVMNQFSPFERNMHKSSVVFSEKNGDFAIDKCFEIMI